MRIRAFFLPVALLFAAAALPALTLDEDGLPETEAAEDLAQDGAVSPPAKAAWFHRAAGGGETKIGADTVRLAGGESVTASVAADEKAHGFDLAFRAHGTGSLKVSMKAATAYGDKPILGRESVSSALIPQHRPYRFHSQPLPLGASACEVEITVEGEAELTALELVRLDKAPPKITEINRSQEALPPGYLMAREPPAGQGRADLAPYADCVATETFEARLRAPVDGSLGTHQRGAFRLDFPASVAIDEVAVTLPQAEILVYADCDGDGTFERPVVEIAGAPAFGTWSDMPEYVWYVKKLEKTLSVKSLFVPTGAWEIRVFGDAAQCAKLPPRPQLPRRPALALGARKEAPVPVEKDRLRFGFTLEPWMFGSQRVFSEALKTGEPPQPVSEWPEWKGLVRDFEYYGANFALLFPPSTFVMPPDAGKGRGSYPFPLLWPSKVWYLNQTNDVLSSFNDACHAAGIESFVIPREWSFADGKTERPKQVVLAEEIAERGADGVPVCVDEHAFGFGLANFGDTLDFRSRYLAKAADMAGWMAQIKEVAAKANPNALTFGGYAGCDHYRRRYECVSGCDLWGFEGKVDVIGGDGTYYGVGVGDSAPLGTYVPAVETAVQLACTPKRLSMATLNCNWGTKWIGEEKRLRNPLVYDDYPSTAFKAGPLVTFFNKGTYANFWRHNFIFENGGPVCREATAVGGRLVKLLSAWGGKKATIPKDVLVLRSRTSEDWWSLAHHDDARSRELGFTLFFWTAARLCENAVPFEIYPMHRPETWRDIAKNYKAIILPFAYAVSDEEATALKAAADAGVRILAPGAYPLGTVDALGVARSAAPALNGVPLERLPFEAKGGNSTSALAAAFGAQLRKTLDARGGPSLTLAHEPDHDVQAYRLDAPDGAALILVVNWSERDTEADISVALPFADGTLEIATEDGLYDAPFAPSIRLALPREAVRLLRFGPRRLAASGAAKPLPLAAGRARSAALADHSPIAPPMVSASAAYATPSAEDNAGQFAQNGYHPSCRCFEFVCHNPCMVHGSKTKATTFNPTSWHPYWMLVSFNNARSRRKPEMIAQYPPWDGTAGTATARP